MVRPWVSALTSFHNTPIFGRIWATVAAPAAYFCALVVLFEEYMHIKVSAVAAQFHGFLGPWCSGRRWFFAPTLRTTAGGRGGKLRGDNWLMIAAIWRSRCRRACGPMREIEFGSDGGEWFRIRT